MACCMDYGIDFVLAPDGVSRLEPAFDKELRALAGQAAAPAAALSAPLCRRSAPGAGHALHATLRGRGLAPAAYHFLRGPDGCALAAAVTWDLQPFLEGPPDSCHGGCIAALFDDACGALAVARLRSLGTETSSSFPHLYNQRVDYKAKTPVPGRVACVVRADEVLQNGCWAVRCSGQLLVLKPDATASSACECQMCCRVHDATFAPAAAPWGRGAPSCQACRRGLAQLCGEAAARWAERGEAGQSIREVPEVYCTRFARLRAGRPLPPALLSVLGREHAGACADPSRAFTADFQRRPRHLLHGTLRGLGLGECVYFFVEDGSQVVRATLSAWDAAGPPGALEGAAPGSCHEGFMVALLDDAFGALARTHMRSIGRSGDVRTAYLQVESFNTVPLPCTVVCAVSLQGQEGRKALLSGRVFATAKGGSLDQVCSGSALFVEPRS